MSDDLPIRAAVAPPPPSPRLLERVGTAGPVRVRRPLVSWSVVTAAIAAWAGLGLFRFHFRPDLPWLAPGPTAAVGLLWLGGFAGSLYAVLVPPRGQVLPDVRRALAVGALGCVVLLAATIFGTRAAPGHSLAPPPDRFAILAAHCVAITLAVFAGGFAIASMVLRRLVPFGQARAGLAAGVGSGAAGGLLLHFVCPYATPAHVGLAHGGTIVLCALLGAALGRLLFDRDR